MKDNQNNKPYLISWITYSKHQLNNILKFHLYILYEEFVKKMNICSLYIYYIKWCLRTFAPISWRIRSEGLDKSITCTDLSGFIQDEIDSISQGTFSASNCHYIFSIKLSLHFQLSTLANISYLSLPNLCIWLQSPISFVLIVDLSNAIILY